MRLIWSAPAQVDLTRLHRFLAPKSRSAATNVLRTLRLGAKRLIAHPRLGEKLEDIEPREVRCLIIQDYELRYEVQADVIVVLRVWHVREH